MPPSLRGELLLAGGGDEEDEWPVHRRLADRLDGGLAYVPAAMAESEHADAASWVRSTLAGHGVGDVTNLGSLDDADPAALAEAGGAFVGGGNAYRLVDCLRESGFDDALRAFVRDGGLLYGGSAGAAVCGASVEAARDENVAGVADPSGLDLLGGYDVWPHYDPVDDDLRAYVAEHGRGVVALTERAGVSVTADRWLPVGYEPVAVCDGDGLTRHRPEEPFEPG